MKITVDSFQLFATALNVFMGHARGQIHAGVMLAMKAHIPAATEVVIVENI